MSEFKGLHFMKPQRQPLQSNTMINPLFDTFYLLNYCFERYCERTYMHTNII